LEAEGLNDGEADGDLEGLTDGETEGEAEGEAEGDLEGDSESEADGDFDGLIEGETDGLMEGDLEGETDGDADILNSSAKNVNPPAIVEVLQYSNLTQAADHSVAANRTSSNAPYQYTPPATLPPSHKF